MIAREIQAAMIGLFLLAVGCSNADGSTADGSTDYSPPGQCRQRFFDASAFEPQPASLADASDGDAGAEDGEAPDDYWSIVVLPDTQNSIVNDPRVLESQVSWILDNRERLRIRHVIQVGDIVYNNTHAEWEIARQALAPLVEVVPTLAAPGNHDFGDDGSADKRTSLMGDYLSESFFQSTHTAYGWFEKERPWNGYHDFEQSGQKWLVLGLEFLPRPEAVAWADRVISSHPDHLIMFFTHSYLYKDNQRYDYDAFGDQQCWDKDDYALADPDKGLDGQQLYDQLLSKHGNFRLVFSGHVIDTYPECHATGQGRMSSRGPSGYPIHQLLANYQEWPHSSDVPTGEGYLRLLEFIGSRALVRTYSPWLNQELKDAANRFELSLSRCD